MPNHSPTKLSLDYFLAKHTPNNVWSKRVHIVQTNSVWPNIAQTMFVPNNVKNLHVWTKHDPNIPQTYICPNIPQTCIFRPNMVQTMFGLNNAPCLAHNPNIQCLDQTKSKQIMFGLIFGQTCPYISNKLYLDQTM